MIPLSPSRASDFKVCPQLFKFRVIDRIQEPANIHSAKGSLVHAVLERLFQLESAERTPQRAADMLLELWEELKNEEDFGALVFEMDEMEEWLAQARALLSNYFALENPEALSPHELEWWVEHEAETVFLRGIIDRVDVTEDGEWILSDYKTGRSPSENYALGSFFALKFYALVCWRTFGKLPRKLRLIHLKEPEVITLSPSPQMLEGLERQLAAIANAIVRAEAKNDWRPRPGKACSWCPHQQICPAFAENADQPASPKPSKPDGQPVPLTIPWETHQPVAPVEPATVP